MNKLNPKDYISNTYGKLTIIEYAGYEKSYHFFIAKCNCEYETIKKYRLSDLTRKGGGTTSCGRCSNGTHHKSNTRLYGVWKGMRQRCNNPNSQEFSCYGGKGVKLCEDWQEGFINFYNWAMENGYRHGLEIDRIDVNGNYEPSNCQFLTKSENVAKCNLERKYKGKVIVKGINKDGEEFVFTNIREFARNNNLDASSITKTCKGIYKLHKDWKFAYID